MTTQQQVEAFAAALGNPSVPHAETMAMPPGLAAGLAGVATHWANEYARDDAKLGSGHDVRAVFALSLGLMLGAAAYREVALLDDLTAAGGPAGSGG